MSTLAARCLSDCKILEQRLCVSVVQNPPGCCRDQKWCLKSDKYNKDIRNQDFSEFSLAEENNCGTVMTGVPQKGKHCRQSRGKNKAMDALPRATINRKMEKSKRQCSTVNNFVGRAVSEKKQWKCLDSFKTRIDKAIPKYRRSQNITGCMLYYM